MPNYFAYIDNEDRVYYPTHMFPLFDKFPYVVRFDSKLLKATNNADKIRKKLKTFGLDDVMLYPLKKNNKSTNGWEVRFKTEVDQAKFIVGYGV